MITDRSPKFKKALTLLEKTWTSELRADAAAAGWPSECVSALTVKADKFKVTVQYPDKYAKEIEDLEYGTQINRPQAVIRLFMDKHVQELAALFKDIAARVVIEEGVI